MKIICAWCGDDMGEKEPYADLEITHGMCDDCRIKLINNYELWDSTKDSIAKLGKNAE